MSQITTVADLMELLEGFDPMAPVRIAFQPNYPLAAEVAAVTQPDFNDAEPETATVWIAATSGVNSYDESPYAPSAAWAGSLQ